MVNKRKTRRNNDSRNQSRSVASGVDHIPNPDVANPEANDAQRIQRVGRNSRCPCGSGRKYKKCCGQTNIPSRHEFAAMLMDMINLAGETAELSYNDAEFSITSDRQVCHLQNIYDEVCAYRDCRQDLMRNFVRVWFVVGKRFPDTLDDVRSDIFPVVVERSSCVTPSVDNSEAAATVPHQLLGDHHAITLVIDTSDVMIDVSQSALDRWGLSFEDALSIALTNLRDITPTPQFGLYESGVYIARFSDHYDPSRLLLPQTVSGLSLQGDPVAVVPNRETLFITGADNGEGLIRMAEMTSMAMELPRRRSGIPLRYVDNRWITYKPPYGHPAAPQFAELKSLTLSSTYASQSRWLGEAHEHSGIDIFVASVFYSQFPSHDSVVSSSVLTKGITTMLPETDLVAFVDLYRREVTISPWQNAVEVLGDHLSPMGLYPERYLTNVFPTDEQLDAIGLNDWTRKPMPFDELDGASSVGPF